MPLKLSILILEDADDDAKLMERALRADGIDFSAQRVESRVDFLRALDARRWDLILADYKLPDFDGRAALQAARERLPLAPVIIVTGALVDDSAVELLREGAADYILKDRLSRLAPAVRRALQDARLKAERLEAEKRYRALFELAHDGIVLVDAATGTIVDCNSEFESQSGRLLERLRQHPVWELWPPDRMDAARARFEQASDGRIAGEELFELCRPDGSTLPIEFGAKVIDLGGRRFILAQVRDITERLRAEARLHAQIDELTRFKKVTVDRELRMQELEQRLEGLTAREKTSV